MDIPLDDLFAQWGHHGWGMAPGMIGWGSGMGWLGTILTAAFWIALIVGIILLIRWLVLSSGAARRRINSEDSALEILKRRTTFYPCWLRLYKTLNAVFP